MGKTTGDNPEEIKSEPGGIPARIMVLRIFKWALLCVLFFILGSALINHHELGHYQHWAVESLRFMGSAQLAYQDTNNLKFYGTFDALRENGLFSDETEINEIVQGYRIRCWVDNRYIDQRNHYVILAIPLEAYKSILAPLVITDDQMVREFKSCPGCSFGDFSTWHIVGDSHD